MAFVERLITRTSQPQEIGVGIDWSNPITRGLAIAETPFTLGTSRIPKTRGTRGVGNAFASTSNAAARLNTATKVTSLLAANIGTTYLAFADPKSTSGACILGGVLGGTPSEYYPQFNRSKSGSASAGTFSLSNSDANFGSDATGVVDGNPHCFVAVLPNADKGLISLYVDGVNKTTSSTAVRGGTFSTASDYVGGYTSSGFGITGFSLYLSCWWNRALSDAEIKSLSANPWQIFEPEVQRIWVDDATTAGGSATVIPIGVQATGSVGTPSATGAARATPAGVSATGSVGAPIAVGGASIPATVLPAGVQATGAVGTVSARGAAVAQPVGVTATGAVGTPVAIAGTSIPATVLPAGVQASSAVGTPTAQGAAISQPLGVAATAYVGTPTIATGVSGVAVAYPAGVQAIGQVGTLIATGAAWTAAVGVQAVASVGTPTAYAGEIVIYVAGAQTRPSRLQSSSRASRLQTGTRASR